MICRHRGFSTVELLVVLVILSVLLAILLPSVASARRTARVTACASNLRQIGAAILAYKTERRQWPLVKPAYFDLTHQGVSPESMSEEERRVITAPYLPVALSDFLAVNSQVYRCPGDTEGTVYEHRRTLTGYGSSYTEWWVLGGMRERRGPRWDWLVSDFAGVAGKGGSVPNPKLHPRPSRWNVVKTDGSVETFITGGS